MQALSHVVGLLNKAIIVVLAAVVLHGQIKAGKIPKLAFVLEHPQGLLGFAVACVAVVVVALAYSYSAAHEGYLVANALVFNTIKKKLGLHKSKANFTAAAPIAAETLNYFASLDIPVYEVFGQSECTGPHTVCAPGVWKVGSCGRPLYGTETRIEPDTKELCYRGRHIFMGYMHDPDKTKETFTADGFLRSGDVADFDKDENPQSVLGGPSGFMKITGRIKELIIGAGGENIAPVLIENAMKAEMPCLSNVMVVGDKRKYLTMLVTLKQKMDPQTQGCLESGDLDSDSKHVGRQIGSEAKTVAEAQKCPKWKAYIDAGVKAANKVAINNASTVQKWSMCARDFTMPNGELTPTLKLKRNVACDHFSADVEAMYKE
jgi:long-chain-fatty-acid--CoA ligase ACSBG